MAAAVRQRGEEKERENEHRVTAHETWEGASEEVLCELNLE